MKNMAAKPNIFFSGYRLSGKIMTNIRLRNTNSASQLIYGV